MTTAPAMCPVCLRQRRLTDEDIVPTWARKHLLRQTSFGSRDQVLRRIKVRICGPCNARLGTQFENRASVVVKPMLDKQSVTLRSRDQRDLAVWIVKTCMLVHVADRGSDSRQGERARRVLAQLLDSGLPPAQTLIRIFGIDMRAEASSPGVVVDLDFVAPPTVFFSVSTLGPLGWEMAIGPTGPILEYQSREPPVRHLVRIWPPASGGVAWPASVVTSREIMALRSAYVRSTRPGMPSPVEHHWRGPDGG